MDLSPVEIDGSALAIFRYSEVLNQFNLISYSKICSFETDLGLLMLFCDNFAVALFSISPHNTY
jgi:hypothetical protein